MMEVGTLTRTTPVTIGETLARVTDTGNLIFTVVNREHRVLINNNIRNGDMTYRYVRK